MAKEKWKGGALLAPVPPAMVSCGTPEQPNVLTIAWTGIINTQPPKTYISVRPSRYSYNIIKESGEFVINLPSVALARETDFVGIYTGAKVDIDDDGSVSVCGTDQVKMDQAIETIRIITTDFEKGMILTGKVVSIKEFGAFLEFAPGKEAMVHISKIANARINRVEDVIQIGDVVRAICLGKDKMGRISFSIKDCPKDATIGKVVASADPE